MLTAEALNDLRRFADEFGREGQVTLSRAALSETDHLSTFIGFCQVLGAIRMRRSNSSVVVRPSGRLARHIPEILCEYLENSFTIIDNWSSVHVIPEDRMSALELVQQLELRRIDQERQAGREPRALADRPVAFAVFRARNDRGENCYLFEVNKDWRRLNFIGGKQEPQDDGDYLETVRREISEELGIARARLTLTRLNDQPLVGYSLSGNTGSLARYPCVLYAARVEGDLTVRMHHLRWLTESTIRTCMQLDECPLMVNPTYMTYLLAGQPSRLSSVPLSTDTIVRASSTSDVLPNGERTLRRWSRIIRENKDLMAAVLTVLAAVIGLVVALSP